MCALGPLDEERKNASFNIKHMTYLLDGGKDETERKERIRKIVESDPIFDNSNMYSFSLHAFSIDQLFFIAIRNLQRNVEKIVSCDSQNQRVGSHRYVALDQANENKVRRYLGSTSLVEFANRGVCTRICLFLPLQGESM
jgi:hypothetical protein